MSKLAIDAYPGTLNLEITQPESLQALASLKEQKGIEITPEQDSFCSARGYPVLIAGKVKGAIIFPCVTGYPENKMELIAPVNIRETLGAKAGDIIEVEIL